MHDHQMAVDSPQDNVKFLKPTSIVGHLPHGLTQDSVNLHPMLKRFQQDLLVLTSFNDNSTLTWRPTWFPYNLRSQRFWTLHNPPNVVTEQLPMSPMESPVYTRRMRRADDPPPEFIKTWAHWKYYCTLYNIPADFLSEEMVSLMRLGLERTETGDLCGKFVISNPH